MAKISPEEKETIFLYNKHNKTATFPLEIEKITFPKYILKILGKTQKRTDVETKKLAAYRKKVLHELQLKSWHLEWIEEEKKLQKRKETQRKIAQNKDKKYQDDPTKIKHFGIWFDNNENAKLAKETYAKIDKKVHNKPSVFTLRFYNENPDIRRKTFDDENCTIYSDEWCAQHRKDCLKNFDLNMSFFSNLDQEKFNKSLLNLLKRRKGFEEIYDINDCEDLEGIYVMVLDHYKQIYIGQSNNIKKRVLQHWRKKKEFDKLIFGSVESSVLSVDVFGCLDTTRIFILKTKTLWDLDNSEKTLIDSISHKFLLNRTAGGIHGNDVFAISEIVANRKEREL